MPKTRTYFNKLLEWRSPGSPLSKVCAEPLHNHAKQDENGYKHILRKRLPARKSSTNSIRLASTNNVTDMTRWKRIMPNSNPLKSLFLISRPWSESVPAALPLQELQAAAGAR